MDGGGVDWISRVVLNCGGDVCHHGKVNIMNPKTQRHAILSIINYIHTTTISCYTFTAKDITLIRCLVHRRYQSQQMFPLELVSILPCRGVTMQVIQDIQVYTNQILVPVPRWDGQFDQ